MSSETATTTTTSPLKIIISGAPASGKGSQCAHIVEKYGVVHVSTGDIFRANIKNGTPLGKKAKGFIDAGHLVPDSVVIDLVKDRLASEDCVSKGWLLDGFPRTGAQATAMIEAGMNPKVFLFLDVPDDVLIRRACGRRLDPVTGDIYHIEYKPCTDPEIAKRLTHRSDDNEEKMANRLKIFHENVQVINDNFSSVKKTIDGNKAPSEVWTSIQTALD